MADRDTKTCYREFPVWIYLTNNERKLQFLALGSWLLLNSSRPENCTQAKIVPQQYQATSGAWVSLTPDLQLIASPPELILEQLEGDWDPESASQEGAYQTEALLRWSEYHQTQYRRRLASAPGPTCYRSDWRISIAGRRLGPSIKLLLNESSIL